MRVAIPSNKPGGLDAAVSPHFGRCDVFTIVKIENGKVVDVSVVENRGTHFGFGATPAEILVSNGVDAVLAQGMGPKALQLLAQSGITTYMASAQTVGEAVRELVEDKVRLATIEEACKEAREPWLPPAPIMPGVGMGMGRGMGRGGRMMGPSPYGPAYPPMIPPTPYPPQMPKPSPPPTGRFKVGVASQGPGGLDDMVSPIFGRCPSFTIVEIEGREIKNVKVIPNQFVSTPRGVGIAVVQMLASEGVKFILAGRFGPWASSTSSQFDIQMVMVPPGVRIRDAINQYIIGSR
ncbi:MAG: NifB/NifX family molybdenum-iron cluster-binding protein [Candidatus Hodarchaeaceae archaeon]|nr:NifB/NifX family molybdenum-iron cluster-binding protein [Candidatus Hodarchaeaceae archaeon]